MCVVMLVTFTESTAGMLAVGDITGGPPTATRPRALPGRRRPLRLLGGVINTFPYTAFALERRAGGADRVPSR